MIAVIRLETIDHDKGTLRTVNFFLCFAGSITYSLRKEGCVRERDDRHLLETRSNFQGSKYWNRLLQGSLVWEPGPV